MVRRIRSVFISYDAVRYTTACSPPFNAYRLPSSAKPVSARILTHSGITHTQPIDRSKVVKHDAKLAEGEIDLTETLGAFGLEGVVITQDELADLVAELDLGKEEAANLVKGIADASAAANPVSPPTPPPAEEAPPKAEKTEKEPRKPTVLHGKPEDRDQPALNPDAPSLPAPPPPKAPSTPPKKPTIIPSIEAHSPPPPAKPVVKIDTTAAPAPLSTTLAASTSTPTVTESPGLLTPASAIPTLLASRETLAQLAQKVEAKRRSRTDAKPRRIPSLSPGVSPLAGNSPLLPGSPAPDGEYELPPDIDDAPPLPVRQRKPSQIESAKPKVAFPVTDPTEAYAYAADPASPSPSASASPAPRASQIPVPAPSSASRTRVLSTSRSGSTAQSPATTTGTPTTRSRATSQHRSSTSGPTPTPTRERKQSTTRGPPSAFKATEDAPPLPKSSSRSSVSSTSATNTPAKSSTTPSSKPATPSRSNSTTAGPGSGAGTPVRERKKSAYGATRPSLPTSASSSSSVAKNDGK
ncbi:hypothetical protein FRB90_009456 [Tulasnella sp. 427]|nr:hypothetical protein FRB90_009456 [Tulasnella sp. 427]